LRIHLAQRFDHLLAAAHADQPVVDDSDLHYEIPCRIGFPGCTEAWSSREAKGFYHSATSAIAVRFNGVCAHSQRP
jgi:hypothetical protein